MCRSHRFKIVHKYVAKAKIKIAAKFNMAHRCGSRFFFSFISLRIKNVVDTAVKIEKFQQNITYILNLFAVLFLSGTTPTLL